jgi:3',5'-cyclic AMP phosphodiesterase CpdA
MSRAAAPGPRTLAAILLLALGPARAGATSGFVFNDLDRDGVRGPGEPGLPGVAVSNGRDVVVTGADGAYSIEDRPGAGIFVIKPRGWRPPLGPQNLPRFHLGPAAGARADFPLVAADEPDSLKALILTDTQPVSAAEMGYLERGVVDRIGRRTDVSFGVTLGDIVYDRPDFFGAVNEAISRIGVPWYSVPGNHDLALGTPDESAAVAAFEGTYGPSTYAFHAGPALFLALDDVRPAGGPRFIGGLTDDQFAFVGNVLRGAPPGEWVVLMLHIPLFSPDPSGTVGFREADRLRLFGLLKGRTRVLILSGHTHYQRHVMHGAEDGWTGGRPIEEYNVAAACGGFWGGPKDADGIPVATMWDGTPPGYATLQFRGDEALLDYFPVRMDAGRQLSVHVPRSVAPRQGYVSFYANVYNGHDGWRVEARVDDRTWGPMRRILGWDPTYAEAFLDQDSAARATGDVRLPDPVVCYHLWRGALPADLKAGAHRVQVRATDPQGKAFVAEAPFGIDPP